jgi:hypothetical protein
MVDTPIVAIRGSSSLPLCRSGAKIAMLIAHPRIAPTTNAVAMLAR